MRELAAAVAAFGLWVAFGSFVVYIVLVVGIGG